MAWATKQLFWVPHRFRYGILVAGGWGNVGDIPTSVIVSVTGAPPFSGTADQDLSVAYISVFLLVFVLTLFPCGGHRWISMDYVGPDIEPEEVKEQVKRRRRSIMYSLPTAVSNIMGRLLPRHSIKYDVERNTEGLHIQEDRHLRNRGIRKQTEADVEVDEKGKDSVGSKSTTAGKHVSFTNDTAMLTPNNDSRSPICSSTTTEVGFGPERVSSPEPTIVGDAPKSILQAPNPDLLRRTDASPPPAAPISSSPVKDRLSSALRSAWPFFSSLLSPPSLGILLAFLIALIPPLKALFVELPPSTSTSKFANPHIPSAPDGHPPLAILLDTTSFLGAASVPLGLICLGSALARLNVPRNQWNTLPIGAIGMLSIGKMIVSPVLGVGIVKGLVQGGLIAKENKLLQFICIFFSCLPTATTQVFLTQVFSGTGSAEHLSAFLIPQYILIFVSMTGLTAYTLSSLF